MEKVTTKTGKEFASDYIAVIPFPPQAYIRIDAPIATVAEVFSNKEETAEMWYEDIHLVGYTHLAAIIPEPGMVKICLAKEG